MTDSNTKSNRGFASMDPEKQREIASRGGRAAHDKGTAHKFTTNEAIEAGKKGGRKIGADKAHMSEIGRKGGQARGAKARARKAANELTQTAQDQGFYDDPPGKREAGPQMYYIVKDTEGNQIIE